MICMKMIINERKEKQVMTSGESGVILFLGILGVFWFDYRVETLFNGLSWLFIIAGAYGLYVNNKS